MQIKKVLSDSTLNALVIDKRIILNRDISNDARLLYCVLEALIMSENERISAEDVFDIMDIPNKDDVFLMVEEIRETAEKMGINLSWL